MSMVGRVDLGVRVGMEKAQFPDEGITRSQLVAGQNIIFEYNPTTFDIIIHAITEGGTAAAGNRFMVCTFTLSERRVSAEWKQLMLTESTSGANSAYKNKFGTEWFFNVRHNWNLARRDYFLYSITDMCGVIPILVSDFIEHKPRVAPIDTNTIRIWGTKKTQTNLFPELWCDMGAAAKGELEYDENTGALLDTTNPNYVEDGGITLLIDPRYIGDGGIIKELAPFASIGFDSVYSLRLQEIPETTTVNSGEIA